MDCPCLILTNENELKICFFPLYLREQKIVEIDATDSAVMEAGFLHLCNLTELKRIKFKNCRWAIYKRTLLWKGKKSLLSPVWFSPNQSIWRTAVQKSFPLRSKCSLSLTGNQLFAMLEAGSKLLSILPTNQNASKCNFSC